MKQNIIAQLDLLRAKMLKLAEDIYDGSNQLQELVEMIDPIRAEVISMPDDEDDDEQTIMLSPALIAALEARGFRQGEGDPPTKEDLIGAIADVLNVPGAKHLKVYHESVPVPDPDAWIKGSN